MCQILRDRYGNMSYLLRYDEMVNWRFQSLFLRMREGLQQPSIKREKGRDLT